MRTVPVAATVVRIGIAVPSRGGTARAVHLGATLDGVLDEAFDHVPVPYRTPTWYRRQDGDSTTLVIPPSVPLRWVATEFAGGLAEALRRRNRHLNDFGRLRLRLAADHGDVVLRPPYFGGAAIARAVWLCEAEVLKAALAAAPELDQLLIVSDRFHAAAALSGGFRRVVVPAGGEREIAWLRTGPDTGTRNTGPGGGLAPS
ncbi:hypothetical protein OG738_27625 [Amycolatopsis sp. NBC_01488]|uniref:hypothetical protein n=1 Tax=Amycolatopsis sp. NBC_01488 TaxID=2903563 RepID=UPI002E2800E8|nr:hypothetical protein [Amycolatopsis sp. NBC_01488]